jgi:hypothetical protein
VTLCIGDGLCCKHVLISTFVLRCDALQPHPCRDGLLGRKIEDLAFEHNAVSQRESVGFQALVANVESFRHGDFGPA